MCDRDDHETVLLVLQTLGKIRRSGYMTLDEQVACLSYCTNRFADNGNTAYFKEFVEYMPDITASNIFNPFNAKSKCYYYAARYSKEVLESLKPDCVNLDTEELHPWFYQYMIDKRIHQHAHIDPLVQRARNIGAALSTEIFRSICESYTVPIVLKSGY